MSHDQEFHVWKERLLVGSEADLAEAFEHYRARLKTVVGVRLGRGLRARVDPSDVLQETFLDARRVYPRYVDSPAVSVFVWLRDLACKRLANLQRDHIYTRKRSIARELNLADASSIALASRLAANDRSPSQVVERKEAVSRLREALERLPETDAEIIILRYFEFLTNEETAEVLGISLTAAAMRHGRALLRLKKLVDEGSAP